MEADTADVSDTSETMADTTQLTVPCQGRPAGPAMRADQTAPTKSHRKARTMPVNQFAHLDSTAFGAVKTFTTPANYGVNLAPVNQFAQLNSAAIGDTATSSRAYVEPNLPASRCQHQMREKPPKQQRQPLYAQQLTLQAMAAANSGGTDSTRLNGFVPTTGITKFKTFTPEEEKGADYNVKRQRNNLSAQKSRQNRKKLEERIRKEVARLEKENSSIELKITDIKTSNGLPLNKSVMTPEEREKCDIEIDNWVTLVEKTGNLFFKDIAAPERTPRPVQRPMEASVNESAEEAAVSSDDGGTEKDIIPNFTYGPSVYGPFVPPPSWNPVPPPSWNPVPPPSWSPVTVQPQYGSIPLPNLRQPPARSRNEHLQEGVVPLNYFVNRGMAALMPAPYGYFVPPGVPGKPILYGASTDGRSHSNTAHNAGLIYGNGQEQQRGRFSDSEALNLTMRRRSSEISTDANPSFINSTKHLSYLGDASAIMSSSARVASHLNTPFKVPLPVDAVSYRHPAETATSNDQDGFKVKGDRFLKPKKQRLRKAQQSMSMDME